MLWRAFVSLVEGTLTRNNCHAPHRLQPAAAATTSRAKKKQLLTSKRRTQWLEQICSITSTHLQPHHLRFSFHRFVF